MNDQEKIHADTEHAPEVDPGFSGLHTRETWEQISQALFKIEQTAVTLQRQAKRAQYYAGAASSLLFLLEQ